MNRITRLVLLAALGAVASCRQGSEAPRGTVSGVEPASASGSGASAERVLSIASNTQVTIGDLRIAAGNVWDSEYAPDGGAPRRGPTAGLWLYFRQRPSEDRHVRAHPGQALEIAGHRIRVVEVQRGGVRVALVAAP